MNLNIKFKQIKSNIKCTQIKSNIKLRQVKFSFCSLLLENITFLDHIYLSNLKINMKKQSEIEISETLQKWYSTPTKIWRKMDRILTMDSLTPPDLWNASWRCIKVVERFSGCPHGLTCDLLVDDRSLVALALTWWEMRSGQRWRIKEYALNHS